ncbi:MAG TPA: glycosyl hydrolase family 8 [Polyangiaceae bacterium]
MHPRRTASGLTLIALTSGVLACTTEQNAPGPPSASGGMASSTGSQSGGVGGLTSTTITSSRSGGSANSSKADSGGSQGGTQSSGGSTSATSVPAGGTSTTSNTSGGRSAGGTNAGGTSGNSSSGATTNKGGASSSSGGVSEGGSSKGGASVGGSSMASQGGSNASGGAATSNGGNSSNSGGATSIGGSGTSSSSTSGTLNGCTATISEATLNQEYADWKKAYVVECPPSQARVQAGGNSSPSNETFSEGIGYGLLLASSFDDRTTFDKLWAYYKANRDAKGLMNWKMNACTGNFYEGNGASDGDLDTAMGLVQGDRRWGGYSTDANALLDAIRTNETMACSGKTILRPGDAWGLECNTGSLNPSYFAPGYYRAFAQYQASQASFWNKFADDSIALLLTYQSKATDGALMGEWAYVDKLADTNYGYNACRTPWRVAVDYAWWGTADAKTYLANVSKYVETKGGVANVPFDMNSAFLGPFALSGIATDNCSAYYQSWMSGTKYDDRYFQATLRVLAMLLMAGKFTF